MSTQANSTQWGLSWNVWGPGLQANCGFSFTDQELNGGTASESVVMAFVDALSSVSLPAGYGAAIVGDKLVDSQTDYALDLSTNPASFD